MAAAICCSALAADSLQQAPAASPQRRSAPINFLYGHLHNSIRTELNNLATWALSLEADNEQDLHERLLHLKERYHFLEQVYKYHSSVEDEVVYPALDTKVKNVTSAYSVEHQDEEYLFEHLGSLLSSALSQTGPARTATVRKLVCKVEEIHITLRKHLSKEEAQLLPLLLQHFSHAEQAELVAQFLYCIPLDTVERVLAWLKPMVPLIELQELMQHLQEVIPDRLLLQLLVTWLNPVSGSLPAGMTSNGNSPAAVAGSCPAAQTAANLPHHASDGAAGGSSSASKLVMCPFAAAAKQPSNPASDGEDVQQLSMAVPTGPVSAVNLSHEQWPPLRGIVLFHHSIRGALEVFAAEAAALQQQAGVTASQLAGLVERHRFLRSVCMFHTLSEEEVMFPEVLRISGLAQTHLSNVLAACCTCQQEHTSEVVLFEELGRQLADVRAYIRRGRTRDVSGMLGQLVSTARKVCSAISTHMQREEAEVLPLLAASLSAEQQRGMVWHTLRAMPLRLLERVLPWILSKLTAEDARGMMTNLRLGAPQVDMQLVELLLRWAERGRWPLPDVAVDGTQGAAGSDLQSAATAVPKATAGHGPQVALGGLVSQAVIDALCRSCDSSTSLCGQQEASQTMARENTATQPAAPAVGDASTDSSKLAVHEPQQQQQQQAWATHDPCYFSNNTCELKLIRQASDSVGSPRKRQRLCTGDVSGNESSSADATPTAAAAMTATAAATASIHQAADALVVSITGQQQPSGEAAAGSSPGKQQQGQQVVFSRTPSISDQAAGVSDMSPQGAATEPAGPGRVAAVLSGATAIGNSSSSISSNSTGCNPIDHIFQFHKALRRELKQLEADAAALEQAVLAACEQLEQTAGADSQCSGRSTRESDACQSAGSPSGGCGLSLSSVSSGNALLVPTARALQQLDGRFQFLWGIYRAHSKAEDEIVFPALESKEALHNVSHAYTLDHEQEEQLFLDLAAVIGRVRSCGSAAEVRDLALQLRRMCAAVRASLETHVRAEEAELWPLFSEHFTMKEQQHLVGVIIGRTGAEVLQALLPWVTGSFNEEETQAMMGSLREATKNTMFDQWLDAVQSGGLASSSSAGVGPAALLSGTGAAGNQLQQQQQHQMEELAEIAEYLTAGLAPAAVDAGGASLAAAEEGRAQPQQQQPQQQQTEVSGTVAESTNYVPGWEDIFNINQKQLEAAIRRVSNDPTLEPQRKAYLIQNIMVSRYIVAQQRRMQVSAAAVNVGGSTGGQAGQGRAAAATASAELPQLAVLPAGSGGVAAGCSHGHERRQDVCGGQPLQQQQQQQVHAGPPVFDSHKAVQQPLPAGAAAVGGVTRLVGHQGHHGTYADAAAGVLGCQHYRRSARLVSPCCGKVFTCRLCHDEVSDHRLDRYAVAEMVCMMCATRQPVASSCSSCGTCLSSYYCGICHLFDDEPGRDIYHCPFCNVCRRGKGLGVDFFHCMQCNACMSLSLFNSHTCRERAMEGNCPVCHEYLFDSATPIKELPCGHFLHSSCFAEYARYSYTCPICCKSIGDMSMYFQMLDSLLASERHRLPAEYAGRQQSVLCQDCGKVGRAPYHFVYHACPSCHSYNTRVL